MNTTSILFKYVINSPIQWSQKMLPFNISIFPQYYHLFIFYDPYLFSRIDHTVLELLVDRGADIEARDYDDKMAMQLTTSK